MICTCACGYWGVFYMSNYVCPYCGSEDYTWETTLYFCNSCCDTFMKPITAELWSLKREVAK